MRRPVKTRRREEVKCLEEIDASTGGPLYTRRMFFHRPSARSLSLWGAYCLWLSGSACASLCRPPKRIDSVSVPVPVTDVQTIPEEHEDLGQPPPTATTLLFQALELHHQQKFFLASSHFRAALASSTLSPAGQTLAYWHLWAEEEALHHKEPAMDALSAFVSVAEDLIGSDGLDTSYQQATDDFATRFALAHKLAYARASQSAVWASRHADFGRSQSRPIVIRSQAELSAYLTLLPRCEGNLPWQVLDRDVALGTPIKGLLWVRLACGQNPELLDLFFEHHTPVLSQVSERDPQ